MPGVLPDFIQSSIAWHIGVIHMSTSKKLRDLQAKKAALVASARAITDQAEKSARDLTDDENTQFQAIMGQIDGANAAIDRETVLIAEESSVDVGATGAYIEVTDRAELDGKRGFKSFGEFASVVKNASVGGRNAVDQRLMAAAPTTFGNESSGPDGGFLVPPDFSRQIFTLSQTEDSLLPMTDNIDIGGNSMVFPKDETVPWGTDGVRAYWQAEATAGTQTKPKLSTTILRLQKLMALVPLTDELVSDTNALDSYLPGKVADSIRWKVNEALLFGNGNGQPLGCFNSGAAIVQAKDAGQAANTVSLANITNMVSRLIPGCYPRSSWLIGPDVLPSLFGLTLGNYPIYLPINQGAQGSPYGTLMGRPIMVSQHAAAFSAQGDILLLDPTYIRSITKAGGIQTATSLHLYFDADAVAFRSTFRVDAQPKIAAPVTQAKGSNQLSAFIQLAAR
jgi:HK97 family phage major capsid protein